MPLAPLDAEDLRGRVGKALVAFLDTQAPVLEAVDPHLEQVLQAATDFVVDGGKRLRPAFAYWGWRGAGGDDDASVISAVASLELLHACALVHDDLMDGSDTRRGRPSVHRRFAALHRERSWQGDPDAFGLCAAVLIGDLCLVWADAMLWSSGMTSAALVRAQPVYDTMRVELMGGQYLDVLAQALGSESMERALQVARFKSAKYTIERPLHLGAALAGAGPADPVLAHYTTYGLALGEAFQLRDDVLGVFGDPAETGKPAGDDLREGKRTVLVAAAFERASTSQAATISALLGRPDLDAEGVSTLQQLFLDTGALACTEQRIESGLATALGALDAAARDGSVAAPALGMLRELGIAATARSG